MKTETSFKKGHKPTYTAKGKDHSRYKHGMGSPKDRNPLYLKWCGMKRRCFNPNEKCYKNYGGRGITVCDKWLNFQGFLEDMGKDFKPGLSLERIDNNGNYSPENCKWVTMFEQGRNKRGVKFYNYKGGSYTIPDLERKFGFKKDTLRNRIVKLGWPVSKAVESRVPSQFNS